LVEVGGRRWTFARPEPALWVWWGDTPLIRSQPPPTSHPFPNPASEGRVANPGGFREDRAGLYILRDGIARGELPAKRVLDSSSGNTANCLCDARRSGGDRRDGVRPEECQRGAAKLCSRCMVRR